MKLPLIIHFRKLEKLTFKLNYGIWEYKFLDFNASVPEDKEGCRKKKDCLNKKMNSNLKLHK